MGEGTDLVWRRGDLVADAVRIDGTSPAAILAVVTAASDDERATMVVAVDTATTSDGNVDEGARIALVSGLVHAGVGGIETSTPAIARRSYDMFAAITHGSLEGLS